MYPKAHQSWIYVLIIRWQRRLDELSQVGEYGKVSVCV